MGAVGRRYTAALRDSSLTAFFMYILKFFLCTFFIYLAAVACPKLNCIDLTPF